MKYEVATAQWVAYLAPLSSIPDASDLWRSATGENPDSYNRPRTPFPTSQTHTEAGRWIADLVVAPGRIDLHVARPAPLPLNQLPNEEFLESSRDLANKVFAQIVTNRVALVVESGMQAATVDAAKEALFKEIPVLPVPPGSSDIVLSFSTNVGFPSQPGMILHRITKWGTGIKQMVQTGPGSNQIVLQQVPILALQLDLGSLQGIVTTLDQKIIPGMLQDLEHQATEVLRVGYEYFR